MNASFIKEFTPTFYEIDFRKKLKLSALFNYLQDSACRHGIRQGLDCGIMEEKGFIWVLSKLRLELSGFPTEGDQVSIETWNKDVKRFFLERDFEITVNGKHSGRATSRWVLIDMASRKPAPLTSSGRPIPIAEGKSDALSFSKALFPSEKNFCYSQHVLYSSIDRNNHVNNARYIDWIFNTFSDHELEHNLLSNLEISYISESRLGDTIDLYRCSHPEGTQFVEGVNRNTGTPVFQASINFLPIRDCVTATKIVGGTFLKEFAADITENYGLNGI